MKTHEPVRCACGKAAQVGIGYYGPMDNKRGSYVHCVGKARKAWCWEGPVRATASAAIAAWNRVMAPLARKAAKGGRR